MKMRNEERETFTTLDAYLAGYLSLNGLSPTLIQKGDRIIFTFPANTKLYSIIDEYNNGATVEASKFAFTIKTLKGQLFNIKNRMV
ncbi:DUF5659 domain-containing protein [Nitrospirota bacterium]